MQDFNYWKKLHENETLEEFSNDTIGLLWLKTKSIIRKELIADFVANNAIVLSETALAKQFVELFDLLCKDPANSHKFLDEYIKTENAKQVGNLDTKQLVSELFKVKVFDWGGDYKNSLDKYLVKKYIKTITPSYEILISKFEPEINVAVVTLLGMNFFIHAK